MRWPRATSLPPLLLLLLAALLTIGSGRASLSPGNEDTDPIEPFLPWSGLSEPDSDLAEVRTAALTRGRASRQEGLAAIADDSSRPEDARATAAFRLGWDAVRRDRWATASDRLQSREVLGSALAADALHLLGASARARDEDAVPLLEQVLADFPEYGLRNEVRLALGRRLGRRGADQALGHFDAILDESSGAGPDLRGRTLVAAANLLERLGRREEAARRLETLYYDMPTHAQSLEAGRRLSRLYRRSDVNSPPASVRGPRALRRADGFAAARNHRRAHENYLEVLRRFGEAVDREAVRVRVGVAEFHRGRLSASLRTLGRISRGDLLPEALYYRGESLRRLERITTQTRVLEQLLALETEHPFGQLALYSLARSRLADNDREEALPFLARLAAAHREGPWVLFANWHVLWDRYRNEDFDGLAAEFERVAREHPGEFMAGQFLYFAGRARERTADPSGAAALYREVFLGYQNSFYGRRAGERLAALGVPGALESPIEDPRLLMDRFRFRRTAEAARIELLYAAGLGERARSAAVHAARAGLPDDSAFEAVNAWLLSESDKVIPAIQALGRAAPFHTSAAGEALPAAWRQIQYPLRYAKELRSRADHWKLNPYLVAGLIRQESAFVARTRSSVGARGLMQVMPATGRALARLEGIRFQTSRLYEPTVSIRFGTRYLRQILDEFADRPELALAGYNAGPHRVRRWTGRDYTLPAEQFIEEIPFTETRNYVKLVMRNEALYRRLYPGLDEAASE